MVLLVPVLCFEVTETSQIHPIDEHGITTQGKKKKRHLKCDQSQQENMCYSAIKAIIIIKRISLSNMFPNALQMF